jgi:mannose-6-phosphate isomerase
MITGHEPQQIDKPWGNELILERNELFVVKRIFVATGQRTSLQSHELKREWVRVESGSVEVTMGDDLDALDKHVFTAGDVYRVPPKLIHRVHGLDDATIFEVASPPSDEDIIRYDDDYGRSS